MLHSHKVISLAAALILTVCAIPSAKANEPPADLCALLPASQVSKVLGQTYEAPQKSVAPRPYANTAEGADCYYSAKGSGKLWFRAYADPSPSAATELFAKLGKFYSPQTPVPGLGDEAYFDPRHGLHVRKGKVRYFLSLEGANVTPAVEKQLKDLAGYVAGQL